MGDTVEWCHYADHQRDSARGLTPGRPRAGAVSSSQARLKWMDYYESHGHNARLTCRYFGVSPQTFYRWRRRYDPHNLRTLEDRSRRPRRLRQPSWSPELAQAVLRLREQYPRWGKDKLVVLLRREGWSVSTSMVGRILRRLREQGVLVDPPRQPVSARKRPWLRPYAVRKPKDYCVAFPGDLVQVDTLDLRPLPGVVLKQFTARDVVSRWDVLMVASRATAHGRQPLPGQPRGADTLPCPGHPGGRRLRVPGRLRGGLPATGDPPLRVATPLPQTQRPRGKGQQNPRRGVLRGG